MRLLTTRLLGVAVGLALLTLLVLPSLLPSHAYATEATPPVCSGNYYTVRPGDTWSIVSQRTGITVAELKRLNPNLVRPNNWLWIGDRLCISRGTSTGNGYWYQVKPGDTWNTVSRATGVTVRNLWRANPGLIDRLYWLYIGQRVWIPTAPVAGPAALAPEPSLTPTPIANTTPTPTPTAAAPKPSGDCAADLAGYPDLILNYLNTQGNTPKGLQLLLTKCGVITEDPDAITTAAIHTETGVDVIVTLHDPALPPPDGSGMLLIYHGDSQGYKLAYQAASTGSAALLSVADLNADKKPDVSWVDTTCGAHTCFTTLYVNSWDNSAYVDWIVGEPTMASAELRFADVTSEGNGQEIILHGGVISSVGAGPQRAWTETYASINGAPYALFSQVFDPSPCLYHKILDANTALNKWTTDGFDAAIAAYQEAIDDQSLTVCGAIADELVTLRDFARLRLSIAQYAAGKPANAQATAVQIITPALRDAANTFTNAYKSSGSIIQACRDLNVYAQTHPASWQFLADWGYANPSFTAEELCPLK